GEDLRIPSVATWWCGQARELEHVIANLDRLVVKPEFPGSGFEPVFGAHLGAAARASLIARMRQRPYAFVAQEQVALSTAPVWCASAWSRGRSCCAPTWSPTTAAISPCPAVSHGPPARATRWSSPCSAAVAARTPACRP